MTVLLVVGILVLLIVAHEFGHFLAAKLFGVKVEEFGVGYPPRAFTFGTWGGTEYTLNWIPFGGFVRLFGDEGHAGKHGHGSMVAAPRILQALILVAGVTANALTAWLLFTVALHVGVPRQVATAQPGSPVQLMVGGVVPGSPADGAGIVSGDKITGIADAQGHEGTDITPQGVVDFVKERGGKPVTISFIHAGLPTSVTIIPAHAVIPGAAERPALGVELTLVQIVSLPWVQAAQTAFTATGNAFVTVVSSLGSIAAGIFGGGSSLSDVVGPVGLVSVVGQVSQNGLGNVLALAGFISVNLAIINLLPIPALDGGRLFLLAIEAIARRNAPRLAVQLLNTFGIALIALLMITVTYHDIARLLV